VIAGSKEYQRYGVDFGLALNGSPEEHSVIADH
jgi:hypothetical protein